MSNAAFIVPTRFTDFARDGAEIGHTWGLRVFDDHDATYDNGSVESMDQLLAMSDAQIVEMARGLNERAASIIDFARESADGIEIFGQWTTWAEIDASAAPGA